MTPMPQQVVLVPAQVCRWCSGCTTQSTDMWRTRPLASSEIFYLLTRDALMARRRSRFALHSTDQASACRLQGCWARQHRHTAAGRVADLCLRNSAGEQVERPVSGPLCVGRPYGYHIIVSSTSAVPLALDVLAQVPQVLPQLHTAQKTAC
jgi:hypothetical protein